MRIVTHAPLRAVAAPPSHVAWGAITGADRLGKPFTCARCAAGDACVDSSNTLRFVVRPPPEISAAEPLSGFQTGGAQVWVKGIGFAQSNALACRFGEPTSEA